MDATRHFQKHNINNLEEEKNALIREFSRIEKLGSKALHDE